MDALEQFNLSRTRLGMNPLDKLPDGVANDTEDTTVKDEIVVEDKTNETITNDKKPEAEIKKENLPKEEKTVVQAKVTPVTELTVEELLAALKDKGHDVEANTKKKTPEEIIEEKAAAKMAWAYSNGKITSKEHNAYIADSNNLQNLVYREYRAEQKELDDTITDSEILEEFNEKYGIISREGIQNDENSRQFKSGQKAIEKIGTQLLREKYANVFKLDDNYSQYESGENSRKVEEDKIRKETPIYKQQIEDIFTKELKTVSVKIGKTEYSVDLPEDVLNTAKSQFLNPDNAIAYIKGGQTKESLSQLARLSTIDSNFQFIVENVAKKYLVDHQKGIKGVPTDVTIVPGEKKKLTPDQVTAIKRFNPEYQEN